MSQISRRGFLRFLPVAAIGGSVLSGSKHIGPIGDEMLEQGFIGGLMCCTNAISVYQPMPDWAFVAARNARLWDAMRTSYLVGVEDVNSSISDRAFSDTAFGAMLGGPEYPTLLKKRGVGQERLPWLARELVDRARRQRPELPQIQFFDWWLRCKVEL